MKRFHKIELSLLLFSSVALAQQGGQQGGMPWERRIIPLLALPGRK